VPDDARNYYRVPGWLRQQAGLGRIGPDARQPAGTAYGLSMENVERGFLWKQITDATNYTGLGATTWTNVDSTTLSWPMWVSGKRPLELMVTGSLVSGAAQAMGLSVAWDGVEVTGTDYGMLIVFNETVYKHRSGVGILGSPVGGRHTVSIVYRVSGGSGGGVQVDGDARLFLSVKEI